MEPIKETILGGCLSASDVFYDISAAISSASSAIPDHSGTTRQVLQDHLAGLCALQLKALTERAAIMSLNEMSHGGIEIQMVGDAAKVEVAPSSK